MRALCYVEGNVSVPRPMYRWAYFFIFLTYFLIFSTYSFVFLRILSYLKFRALPSVYGLFTFKKPKITIAKQDMKHVSIAGSVTGISKSQSLNREGLLRLCKLSLCIAFGIYCFLPLYIDRGTWKNCLQLRSWAPWAPQQIAFSKPFPPLDPYIINGWSLASKMIHERRR